MTPRTLQDVRFQENNIRIIDGEPEKHARKFFKDVMNDEREVYCRKLFREDGYNVWEAYTDSGSTDYLYIMSKYEY